MALEEHVHRLTTAEYERMVERGALEDLRVELLDGLLVEVSPQGERHARVIQELMKLCAGRLDLLRVQMPLALADGWEPEPDVALAVRHPDPDQAPDSALLVIEVAVTSQAKDRQKAAIYAAAGIPRFWLIDLTAHAVLDHAEPCSTGYEVVTRMAGDDLLVAGIPGIGAISVADLLRVAR